jgi:hypothetical protein
MMITHQHQGRWPFPAHPSSQLLWVSWKIPETSARIWVCIWCLTGDILKVMPVTAQVPALNPGDTAS